jgi:hypothetical protein
MRGYSNTVLVYLLPCPSAAAVNHPAVNAHGLFKLGQTNTKFQQCIQCTIRLRMRRGCWWLCVVLCDGCRGKNLFHAGMAREGYPLGTAVAGDVATKAMESGKGNYLANLVLYPGENRNSVTSQVSWCLPVMCKWMRNTVSGTTAAFTSDALPVVAATSDQRVGPRPWFRQCMAAARSKNVMCAAAAAAAAAASAAALCVPCLLLLLSCRPQGVCSVPARGHPGSDRAAAGQCGCAGGWH